VKFVMPANAGIQVRFRFKFQNRWIPAGVHPEPRRRAGMTGTRVDFQSTNSEPLDLEPRVVQSIVRTKKETL
jgi:hypothetical protein